jgi:hypothetical protein
MTIGDPGSAKKPSYLSSRHGAGILLNEYPKIPSHKACVKTERNNNSMRNLIVTLLVILFMLILAVMLISISTRESNQQEGLEAIRDRFAEYR